MIPQKFLECMKKILDHDEYVSFVATLAKPSVRALRVNTSKTNTATILPLLPFDVTPLPFCANAYYVGEEKVGALPAHHAGMFYMQDPGAVSTVAAIPITPGMRVIDLCAAPGGKATQLASAIGDDGILIANEYVPARCRILQGNIERMGVRNTVVTNLDTAILANHYGTYFDLVVVDAPCSGEGMFRKYEIASEEWSEENVTLCAMRQREILKNAVQLVKPGGRLLYSTCTFSLTENEENVAWLLDNYPDFSLLPVNTAVVDLTADGISTTEHDLSLCRRFYPHRSPGEGQFLAYFKKGEQGSMISPATPPKTTKSREILPLSKEEIATVTALFRDLCNEMPSGFLYRIRDAVFLAPDIPLPPFGIFAAGVCVGTWQKKRIEPHHQLYSALGTSFTRQLRLTADDPRVAQYLRGEEIDCPELLHTSNGYTAVLFEGAPLGGGKHVSGKLKNHYPKGLRTYASTIL